MAQSTTPCRSVDQTASDARSREAALLRVCLDAAASAAVSGCREAHVVRLASQLLRSEYPEVSDNLQRAYDSHAREHGCPLLTPMTLVEQGWVLGLARFRDMLAREFKRTVRG